jgi:vanadium chloroperoxidase
LVWEDAEMEPILFWNDVALEVHRRDFTYEDEFGVDETDARPARKQLAPEIDRPTRTSRMLAMAQLAAYDAWRAHDPLIGDAYVSGLPQPAEPSSAGAAVGAAVFAVLRALYVRSPAYLAERRQAWRDMLAITGETPAAVDAGEEFGAIVAAAMLALRTSDGADADETYEELGLPGTHKVDPFAAGQGYLGPKWGRVRPFGFPSLGPVAYMFHPPLGETRPGGHTQSLRWKAEFDEARAYGGAPGTFGLLREPEATLIGVFWGYDGARGIGTPPRLYNQHIRMVSRACGLTTDDNAVLFALVNMAMADAAIAAWAEKYQFHVARPVIGIREAASGFGRLHGCSDPTFPIGAPGLLDTAASYGDVATWLSQVPSRESTETTFNSVGDPGWAPLGAPQTNVPGAYRRTPNFPSYPSGHATFGAACFESVAAFLRTLPKWSNRVANIVFQFESDELDGRNRGPDLDVRPRHCRSMTLGQAIHENALSRIYLGLHWRMDAVEGIRLGLNVARALFAEGRGPAAGRVKEPAAAAAPNAIEPAAV